MSGGRSCGACGRELAWWRSATWHFGILRCRHCRRTRPSMTRQEVWVEVRYRLVVVGIAALVLGAMAMSLRGSVHVSTGPATEWPGYAPEFVGTVTAWSPGQPTIGGWIENRSLDAPACPYLMAWVWSGDVQGHLTLNLARPGPLKVGERAAWTGTVLDPTGRPARLWKAPGKDSVFACIWPLPSPSGRSAP